MRFCGLAASEATHICGHFYEPDTDLEPPFPQDERGKLWTDKEWISPELTQRYPFLESGFIGEIFCRLAYLEGPVPRYRVPRTPIDSAPADILIATAASLDNKRWPAAKWADVLSRLKGEGYTIGLIGAPPKAQGAHWTGLEDEELIVQQGLVEDLRGKYTIPQVVDALGKAKAVLTIDNGILHLAVSTGVPTVGLYRHGIHRLWAPPYDNLRVITPGEGRAVAQIEEELVYRAVTDAL